MAMSARVFPALLVGCLAIAACSGDDDAGPATTTMPDPASTTTEPPTATTATTTTEPTPTTGSALTTAETQTDRDAVVAAYEAAYDAYWAAALRPSDPSLRRALEDTHSDRSLDFVIEQLDQLAVEDERLVDNSAVDDGFVIEAVAIDGDSATVLSCVTNPWIWVRSAGSQQTATSVLNDEVVSTRERDTYQRRPNGTWIRVDGVVVETFPNQLTCDA